MIKIYKTLRNETSRISDIHCPHIIFMYFTSRDVTFVWIVDWYYIVCPFHRVPRHYSSHGSFSSYEALNLREYRVWCTPTVQLIRFHIKVWRMPVYCVTNFPCSGTRWIGHAVELWSKNDNLKNGKRVECNDIKTEVKAERALGCDVMDCVTELWWIHCGGELVLCRCCPSGI